MVHAAEQGHEAGEGLFVLGGQVGLGETAQQLHQSVVRVVRHGGVALLAFIRQGGDLAGGLAGDHVHGRAHLGSDSGGVRLFEDHVGDVHFTVDHRVAGVRGEGHGGLALHLPIPLHAGGAPLLVAAQKDADPALHLRPALLQGVQGVEGGHRGPLVVRRAPAVHGPVVDLGPVGGIGPACALRDHVQVGHHRHQLVPFAVLHHAAAGFHVPHVLKAQLFRDLLGLPKGVVHVLSVGHALPGLAPGHGGDADEFLQVLHLVFKAFFDDVAHGCPPIDLLCLFYHKRGRKRSPHSAIISSRFAY